MEMRNIQEKVCGVCFCVCVYVCFELGIIGISFVHNCTKTTWEYPVLISWSRPQSQSPDLFPSKFPYLRKWQLYSLIFHDSSLLNPIFDPSANSAGFSYNVYTVYEHFSPSSRLPSKPPSSFTRLLKESLNASLLFTLPSFSLFSTQQPEWSS